MLARVTLTVCCWPVSSAVDSPSAAAGEPAPSVTSRLEPVPDLSDFSTMRSSTARAVMPVSCRLRSAATSSAVAAPIDT